MFGHTIAGRCSMFCLKMPANGLGASGQLWEGRKIELYLVGQNLHKSNPGLREGQSEEKLAFLLEILDLMRGFEFL